MLEVENMVSVMKNSFGLTGSPKITKERISELESRSIEIAQTKTQRECVRGSRTRVLELKDSINISVIHAPIEGREWCRRNILKNCILEFSKNTTTCFG